MNINIVHQKDLLFEGKNSSGAKHLIDGNALEGLRPMESLLNALASCAALDIISILKKQKQDVQYFEIEINGTRPDEGQVKPFTKIEMVFKLRGVLEESKVVRAIQLSVDKYCSVKNSLNPSIQIIYTHQINTV